MCLALSNFLFTAKFFCRGLQKCSLFKLRITKKGVRQRPDQTNDAKKLKFGGSLANNI